MMAMARGAEYIKGTFTTQATSSAYTYTLELGKSLNSYLFLIEMTDESKTALLATGDTTNRAFSFLGVYPKRSISSAVSGNNMLVTRTKPSAKTTDPVTSGPVTISDTSITFTVYPLTITGANYLYAGFTYNYTIVPLDII